MSELQSMKKSPQLQEWTGSIANRSIKLKLTTSWVIFIVINWIERDVSIIKLPPQFQANIKFLTSYTTQLCDVSVLS